MNLLRFPGSLLLHLFFIVSILLHVLSLLQQDFRHETQLSHLLQILSYGAGWLLLFTPVKNREYLFPLAGVIPWMEHLRILFMFYLNPDRLAFWVCLLVVVLMPYLSFLLFRARDN